MVFKNLLVLGAGSAGLLAALSIKRKMPGVVVRVVRSPEIAVIGVGESTTPNVPAFLFDYLGISSRAFYQMAEPTWKLGIHFLWGPRNSFEYSFVPQLDIRLPDLPRPTGYYCDQDFSACNPYAAMMSAGKAFLRNPNGVGPDIHPGYAFHLDNARFVKTLERFAIDLGIEIIDGKMSDCERGPEGIRSITLEDGRRLAADFFIDASGFRSELLGKVLEEPFVSFDKSLFNDRAILGNWKRTDEPIQPHTTAETMDAGWSWQIDHEHAINRGYVYSSAHISDERARLEFAKKNPRAMIHDRTISFKSGVRKRGWVDNVMAIGNACGFVEPLEATALMIICWQLQTFIELTQFVGPTPSVRNLFNRVLGETWEDVRDFLTLHYTTNTRLNTPYWQRCRAEADASGLGELLEFYDENGPTGFARYNMKTTGSQFGIEGYLVMLVGNQVPYRNRHIASGAELARMAQYRAQNRALAAQALTAEESLACIRHPGWRWFNEIQPASSHQMVVNPPAKPAMKQAMVVSV